MQRWVWFLGGVLLVHAAGCKSKPSATGDSHEVRHEGGLAVKLTGPIPLAVTTRTTSSFMVVENLGPGVHVSIGGCSIDLEPGERRGCYGAEGASSDPRGELTEGPREARVALRLEEAKLERVDESSAKLRALVRNGSAAPASVIRARFDVVDAANHLVGAGDAAPFRSRLLPGEASFVDVTVPLVRGATGALTLHAPVAFGVQSVREAESNPPRATLTKLELQSSTKKKQLAAVLTNSGTVPIKAEGWFYLKDAQGRVVGSGFCQDTVRTYAPAPLAPQESTPCVGSAAGALPPYDRVEVEAAGVKSYDGAPVSFTPLAVKETRVSDGTIAVIVEKPAPKMGFYIRAKPDWLRIDYANDQQPYEYRLDGATSAEVTAFAVGGPPGDWKPIVQNGSD
ncbi:MAG: hypothetical protein U0270_06415 [Labilithrix sp.]